MATAKKRVHISIPKATEVALGRLAKRDQVPQATKAAELLRLALELEEDQVLEAIAASRGAGDEKYVAHKDAWA